jgi:uncharacterized membrane protein YidH (DUF202 family)
MTPRDPGLQPERTVLAWQRTALSATILAVLLLRDGIVRGAPSTLVAGAVVGLAGMTMVVVSRTRRRTRWAIAVITGGVVVAGLLVTAQMLLALACPAHGSPRIDTEGALAGTGRRFAAGVLG